MRGELTESLAWINRAAIRPATKTVSSRQTIRSRAMLLVLCEKFVRMITRAMEKNGVATLRSSS